jgi:hypothetical protein
MLENLFLEVLVEDKSQKGTTKFQQCFFFFFFFLIKKEDNAFGERESED